MLPPAPACVLLAGDGLEVFATSLSAHGYHPAHAGPSLHGAFSMATGQPIEPRQVVIVGALATEVDALTLFSSAYDALAVGGMLVLLAPAARHAAVAARSGVNPDDYLNAVAARHGFSIPNDAAVPGARVFVKSTCPRWRVCPVRAQHVPAVLALFREVFGHEMTAAHWQWKYGDGRGASAVARRDGAIVAHYGGVTRPILLFGQPARAFQICDVMVDLKERAVFTKTGPFFLTAASFAESAVTARSPFGFGFPNARVMRLAEKTGLYSDVGGMTEIRWQPLPDRPRLLTRVRHLSPDDPAADEIIDRLWKKMSRDLRDAVVGVRDSRYIRHRYFNHPDKHYDVLVITGRWSGAAHGILVLRRDEGRCELLDVVAPLKGLPMLIDQARRLLSHWGFGELYAWITQQYARFFTATGGQQHALDIRIPTSKWIDGPAVEAIRDKWWLTAGDTDFR
ncbi:MAG: GNAT family N-acetyltransferase [Gammaproteobacteria bacterium]|nr:GNAT family N-acetyltransferase [Gammaproteobacteria bacterium]